MTGWREYRPRSDIRVLAWRDDSWLSLFEVDYVRTMVRVEGQQQVPFRNDRQKSKGNNKNNNKGKDRRIAFCGSHRCRDETASGDGAPLLVALRMKSKSKSFRFAQDDNSEEGYGEQLAVLVFPVALFAFV